LGGGKVVGESEVLELKQVRPVEELGLGLDLLHGLLEF
jgi:hypothetical protein